MRRRVLPTLMVTLAAGALVVGAWSASWADEGAPQPVQVCAPSEPELEPLRYLRALSLDLRGVAPTSEEYAAVRAAGTVPDGLIDEWLASEAFASQAVRRHQALTWNRVNDTRLIAFGDLLQPRGGGDERRYARIGSMVRYRGSDVYCSAEPARFDPLTNEILFDEVAQPDGTVARIEGYVVVRPYWAPQREMKVCAFDAQERAVSPSGTDCSTGPARLDTGCGCGPNLQWCSADGAFRRTTAALGASLDQLMFDVFSRDAPYTELFTSRKMFVNGPLVSFFRHRTRKGGGLVYEPLPFDARRLPDIPFTDEETWAELEVPPHHAGLLTHPAFLLRFQTNRARANRFYDAWLCQPFNPPDGGLPVSDEASARNPDLQLRSGCKYCHALLEPAASHWGRWTEQGTGYLNPVDFPRTREDCFLCGTQGRSCTAECRNFYVTRALSPQEEPFIGSLQSYAFRRADHEVNVEQGPRFMAFVGAADNRMPRCVARRTGEWLLGREMERDGDSEWIDELARGFVQSGYSYRWLVKRVVTDARYWRVR